MEPTCAVFPAWQMDSLPGKSNMRLYDPIKKKQQLRNFPRGPADKNPMQGLDQPNPWGVWPLVRELKPQVLQATKPVRYHKGSRIP